MNKQLKIAFLKYRRTSSSAIISILILIGSTPQLTSIPKLKLIFITMSKNWYGALSLRKLLYIKIWQCNNLTKRIHKPISKFNFQKTRDQKLYYRMIINQMFLLSMKTWKMNFKNQKQNYFLWNSKVKKDMMWYSKAS